MYAIFTSAPVISRAIWAGRARLPSANVHLDATDGSIGEVAVVGCTIQHAHEAPDSANIRINCASNPVQFTDEVRHGHITIANNVLSDVQVNIDIVDTRAVDRDWQHDVEGVHQQSSRRQLLQYRGGRQRDRSQPSLPLRRRKRGEIGYCCFRTATGAHSAPITSEAPGLDPRCGSGSAIADVLTSPTAPSLTTNVAVCYSTTSRTVACPDCLIRDDRANRDRTSPLEVIGGSSNQIDATSPTEPDDSARVRAHTDAPGPELRESRPTNRHSRTCRQGYKQADGQLDPRVGKHLLLAALPASSLPHHQSQRLSATW